MKKIFMLLMFAGATVMFTACGSNSSDSTVISQDTVSVETEYEVEQTAVEVDTTTSTETETVETEQPQQ